METESGGDQIVVEELAILYYYFYTNAGFHPSLSFPTNRILVRVCY